MSDEKISGLPVTGYRQQGQEAINAVNQTKQLENQLGAWIKELSQDKVLRVDPYWIKVAVADLQKGFMALNRAVFKPHSEL